MLQIVCCVFVCCCCVYFDCVVYDIVLVIFAHVLLLFLISMFAACVCVFSCDFYFEYVFMCVCVVELKYFLVFFVNLVIRSRFLFGCVVLPLFSRFFQYFFFIKKGVSYKMNFTNKTISPLSLSRVCLLCMFSSFVNCR